MIRVLHVIGAMDRGGAETLLMNLYRAIDRSAIQFDFVVHTEQRCDYDDEIEGLGGRIFRVPRFTGLNAKEYGRAFRQFFAEHSEYSIVHGHIGSSSAIYLGQAKRAGCYTIAHSHAKKFPLSLSEIGFRIFSYPTRFIADFFMAASSEAGRDRYGRVFSDPARSKILKNGIDLDLYRCDEAMQAASKEELGLAGTPLIGHIGRLAPEKNHAFLLETVVQVKRQIPSVKLVCAGRGPLLSQLSKLSNQLGIADSVEFLGVRDDIPELLRAFDLFLFPSITEGLGISAIEAQAAGVPSLLSTGVPEEAEVSTIVQRIPLDEGPVAWADRCVALLGNLPARQDHREEVRSHGFDIRDSASWLSNFYQQTAANR